jgi:small-conductance mechanosensitive channel/CRP-like cAMP-binding protein
VFLDSLHEGTYLTAGFLVAAAIVFAAVKNERRPTLLAVLGFLLALLGLAFLSDEKYPRLSKFSQLLEALSIASVSGMLFFRVLLPRAGFASPRILQDVVVGVAYIVCAVVIMGGDAQSILTTSALLTAIIGFSMQDTLGNILGGLALQLDDSIHKGDWIKLDDLTGRVVDTRWRFTAIETRNWETVLIPNSVLMKNKFMVLGRRQGEPVQWRRWVWFNVDFRTPPQKVIETVGEAIRAADIQRVAKKPEPNCILMDFTDSYGRYAVRYWLTDLAVDDPTDSEVRAHIYAALYRNSIPLSIPAHAIFVTEDTAERKAVKAVQSAHHRRDVLQHVDLFHGLQPEELEQLAQRLVPTPFAKGDVMTRQGAQAHWLYIIVDGHAEVILQTETGETRKVGTLGPGSFFGEMGLMTGEPRLASVIAKTDVESYRLDKDSFHGVLHSRPGLAEEISHILAKRRTDLDAALHDLNAEMKAKRVSSAQQDILGKIRSIFGLKA